MPPFRFLADAREIVPGRELAERARRAEGIGYHALVIPDHLLDQLSPLVAMTAVAAATSTLRVGAFVLNNDLRHPAVLAQDLAAIDVISDGRLDIAIGAGWNRPEYQAIGMTFDPTPVRQARLAESVTVIKQCLLGEPFSFAGEHYRITEYTGQPSVQRPHPPVMIGGGGRRTLTLAAREADIVGLAPRITPNGLGYVQIDPRHRPPRRPQLSPDRLRSQGAAFDGRRCPRLQPPNRVPPCRQTQASVGLATPTSVRCQPESVRRLAESGLLPLRSDIRAALSNNPVPTNKTESDTQGCH